MNDFRIPTRVRIAPGCAGTLRDIVADLGAHGDSRGGGRRSSRSGDSGGVMLVTDTGVGAIARAIAAQLREAGLGVQVFDETEVNPRTTTAERIAEDCRRGSHGLIVGVGGGSVLDAAKAAAMLATNEGSALDFVGKNLFANRPLPYVAVPTTCGTGSEVTWVAVLTDPATSTKISIKGDGMFPDFALVDAEFVSGLPGKLVASTGLDALTHAVEATTGRLANPATDALAEKSIELTFRYLQRAVIDIGGDLEARDAVVRSATLAGMAFGNADVAGVHCLSESIGGLIDAPHGLTNAMLLAPVLRHHVAHIDTRLREIDVRLPDDDAMTRRAPSAERFITRIEALVDALDIPPFSSLGLNAEQLADIAERAARNGSNDSNPGIMVAADYARILASLG